MTSGPKGGSGASSPTAGQAAVVISHRETLVRAPGPAETSSIMTPLVGQIMASVLLPPNPTHALPAPSSSAQLSASDAAPPPRNDDFDPLTQAHEMLQNREPELVFPNPGDIKILYDVKAE
jgi:hypothetical protein